MKSRFAIIGGGIAGLTTAIALKKIGIQTTVFEAAPSIKAIGAGLALAANAMKALNHLGLMDEVILRGRKLPYFSIYDQQGRLITQTNSSKQSDTYGLDNFTIHRADLHQFLLSKTNAHSVYTNKKAVDFEHTKEGILIKFQDGSTHETEYLIVADGIHSQIRKKLLPNSIPRFSGYTCWRAVIDNQNLNLTESSETWGSNGRFGVVPLADNKIYWFACVNAKSNSEHYKNFRTKDLLLLFKDFHSPIPEILKETKDENLIWNDITDLKPLQKYAFNNILLIGDAAHATTPNMGQGACQAIEDAVILADELSKITDPVLAFKSFEKRRLARTHYITNTSAFMGKVAQLENKLLMNLRNFVFRNTPPGVNQKQLEKIYKVDF